MVQDMRHVIASAAVAFVLHQHAKVIQNSQILLNDILLGGTGIIGGQNVQLLRGFRNFKHKFK